MPNAFQGVQDMTSNQIGDAIVNLATKFDGDRVSVNYDSTNNDHASEKRVHIAHVLNDLDVGGIRTVIESISESKLADQFQFSYHALSPRLWLKPLGADIIMFHNASNWRALPRLAVVQLINPKAKIVIQEHHYTKAFESSVPKNRRFLTMLRLNYALVDKVVAVSQGQGKWIKQRQLLPKNKLSIIPQSCRVDQFMLVPFKPFRKKLVLAAYGRFHTQKGFDLLIKAAKKLPHVKIKLGGLGPEEQTLRRLARGCHNIEFCGQVYNVPMFLAACDAVVIPSRFEPFGLVGLEARAAGRPIIVTDVDGLPEQAHDCGLVVNANDEEALIDAIESLDPVSLRRMAHQARESARATWDVYLDRWRSLLIQLLRDDVNQS